MDFNFSMTAFGKFFDSIFMSTSDVILYLSKKKSSIQRFCPEFKLSSALLKSSDYESNRAEIIKRLHKLMERARAGLEK